MKSTACRRAARRDSRNWRRFGAGTYTAAYGTLNSVNGAASGGNVAFAATQVLAGSSIQSTQFDRLSGVVIARSGDVLTMPAATLVTSAGADSYPGGTATVQLGAGTAVALPAQGIAVLSNSIAQISVGSRITVFGAASAVSAGNLTFDATAGRVRLANTPASGLVTAQGSGALSMALATLGDRSPGPFSFSGTGASGGGNSNPNQYVATTGGLVLSNATVGTPVEVSGLVNSFGSAPPDFGATSLYDHTTIAALLAIDWGAAGSTTPFAASNGGELDLNNHDPNIGLRHRILVGAQSIDVGTLSSDLLIVPNGAATTLIYAIGHASTSTVENFNTFAEFVTALQTELNGTTAATALTADGLYTPSSETLSANSVSIYLND